VNIPVPFETGVFGSAFTGSVTFAAGRDPSIDYGAFQFDVVATGELAGTVGDPFPSAYARVVGSMNPSVVPQDLRGAALSVTGDALLLSGSVTFLRALAEGDLSTRLYEFGFTTPSVGASASVGAGVSIPDLLQSTFVSLSPVAAEFPPFPSQPVLDPTFTTYTKQ